MESDIDQICIKSKLKEWIAKNRLQQLAKKHNVNSPLYYSDGKAGVAKLNPKEKTIVIWFRKYTINLQKIGSYQKGRVA